MRLHTAVFLRLLGCSRRDVWEDVGPGVTHWGANTVNGVNITTKQAGDTQGSRPHQLEGVERVQ
jgi:hypothetical protein